MSKPKSRKPGKEQEIIPELETLDEDLDLLDILLDQLSLMRDKVRGIASDLPCPGERRQEEWHGEEEREKDIVSEDRTSTDDDGESNLLDLMGTELWSRFHRKKMQTKRRRRPARKSRVG